jgi:hypothetical protein
MQDEHYHEKENGQNVAYRHCCYYLVQTNETINIDMSVYVYIYIYCTKASLHLRYKLFVSFCFFLFVLRFLSAFVFCFLV